MNVINSLTDLFDQFHNNIPMVLACLAGLWVIHFVNLLLGYRLNYLGIMPRTWHGAIGIVFSPFLHANINHLFFNSIPLFVLLNMVLLSGLPVFICVTVIVTVLGGFLVWLLGRPGIHIGASLLIMGYWGYLLMEAISQPSINSIVLGIIAVYYLGWLVYALLPGKRGVSVEGHIYGFLAGIFSSYATPWILGFLLHW